MYKRETSLNAFDFGDIKSYLSIYAEIFLIFKYHITCILILLLKNEFITRNFLFILRRWARNISLKMLPLPVTNGQAALNSDSLY